MLVNFQQKCELNICFIFQVQAHLLRAHDDICCSKLLYRGTKVNINFSTSCLLSDQNYIISVSSGIIKLRLRFSIILLPVTPLRQRTQQHTPHRPITLRATPPKHQSEFAYLILLNGPFLYNIFYRAGTHMLPQVITSLKPRNTIQVIKLSMVLAILKYSVFYM